MKGITCSAPGKLFLGGEYAVLAGAEAVVTAVNRRASAFSVADGTWGSPLVLAVHKHITAHLNRTRDLQTALPPIGAASTGFSIDHHKVGLGSSAAVAAAATGLLFELAGLPIQRHRDEILTAAQEAHSAAQGGNGSGADVAAAVTGGTIIFSLSGQVAPIALGSVRIVTVWSGESSSTSEMIRRIQRFERDDSAAYQTCFDQLAKGASHLANAFRRGAPNPIIDAASDYGAYLEELGRASGAPIITKPLKRLMNLARNLGGAAKPSGAGGGDIAVAFFDNDKAVVAFRRDCIRHELRPLDLEVGASGLTRES